MNRHPSSRAQSELDEAGDSRPPETHEAKTDIAESGGPKGPEPTRYGDWEKNGRCIDF